MNTCYYFHLSDAIEDLHDLDFQEQFNNIPVKEFLNKMYLYSNKEIPDLQIKDGDILCNYEGMGQYFVYEGKCYQFKEGEGRMLPEEAFTMIYENSLTTCDKIKNHYKIIDVFNSGKMRLDIRGIDVSTEHFMIDNVQFPLVYIYFSANKDKYDDFRDKLVITQKATGKQLIVNNVIVCEAEY